MPVASPERLKAIQSKIQSGNFAGASSDLNAILRDEPGHQDAIYMAAVCARYDQRFDDAKAHLTALKRIAPDFGRAFQEEGHLRLAMGDSVGAIHAFQHATRFNPALTASWTKLADLLAASGHEADAQQAASQLQRMNALPRELLAVINHIHENRVLRAEEICRAFLKKHPHHVEGMRLLADIGSRLSVLTDADFLLETAIELEPENLPLRIDHMKVLRKRQKYQAAYKQAQFLYDKDPQSPLFQSLLAIESMHAGEIDRALELFDSVLERMPDDLAALTSRGHALKTFGRTQEAIASYRRSVEVSPRHGDGWYALANLKTFRFSEADIVVMQDAEQHPDLPLMSRIHIAFALGKALEDADRYDEAFDAYERGNTLKRHQTRYTSEQMDAEFSGQKTQCTKALFETRSGVGCQAPDPIFIVGLPRAGSTLLEQILASHSQVDGTLELPNILALSHRLRGRSHISDRERYPRILHELDDTELEKLGQDYIDNTRVHRHGAPFFTDKMPNNFRHIGLIHLILPNAKIIDARRAALDCCWSGYKQLFSEGQEFTYGLEEIGYYYAGYTDLMDHWNDVLPEGCILTVQHEDVLKDLEGQVRRMLDYCGLPFEEACVDFHKTDRAVRTASSEQVRQPINTSGVEQWRPFERHLAPLKDALGALV